MPGPPGTSPNWSSARSPWRRVIVARDTSPTRPPMVSRYRGARGREDLPGPGMHESRSVEVPARLPHPLGAPVHRVVVGTREQPEAELGQIPRDGGQRHEAPVVPRSRGSADRPDVEYRGLEVAERRAGTAQEFHDPPEPVVAL